MKVFAIADLHLSLRDGVLSKPMDRFGAHWKDHHVRIAEDWDARVDAGDIVLLPGDLSWALKPHEVAEDLAWIHARPGRKVLLKGNHDFWMPSRRKLLDLLPPSIMLIQHDALLLDGVLLFGTRLWIIPELSFPIAWTDVDDRPPAPGSDLDAAEKKARDEKLLQRELGRLQLSIDAARKHREAGSVACCLAMTHFPPTDFSARKTAATELIAQLQPDGCVFGHLHQLASGPPSVTRDGIVYRLTSCDFLDFRLAEIAEL